MIFSLLMVPVSSACNASVGAPNVPCMEFRLKRNQWKLQAHPKLPSLLKTGHLCKPLFRHPPTQLLFSRTAYA